MTYALVTLPSRTQMQMEMEKKSIYLHLQLGGRLRPWKSDSTRPGRAVQGGVGRGYARVER